MKKSQMDEARETDLSDLRFMTRAFADRRRSRLDRQKKARGPPMPMSRHLSLRAMSSISTVSSSLGGRTSGARTVHGKANFGGAQFHGKANFGDVQFHGEADFRACSFTGRHTSGAQSFTGKRTSGTCSFTGTRTSGLRSFTGRHGSGRARSFTGMWTSGPRSFRGERDCGDCSVSRGGVVLGRAVSGGGGIRESAVSRGGDFDRAQFQGEARFDSASFGSAPRSATLHSVAKRCHNSRISLPSRRNAVSTSPTRNFRRCPPSTKRISNKRLTSTM